VGNKNAFLSTPVLKHIKKRSSIGFTLLPFAIVNLERIPKLSPCSAWLIETYGTGGHTFITIIDRPGYSGLPDVPEIMRESGTLFGRTGRSLWENGTLF